MVTLALHYRVAFSFVQGQVRSSPAGDQISSQFQAPSKPSLKFQRKDGNWTKCSSKDSWMGGWMRVNVLETKETERETERENLPMVVHRTMNINPFVSMV